MVVDNKMVAHIAFLSRIGVDKDKTEAVKNEFNKILNWIDELSELDTEEVEPLASVSNNKLLLRKDEVTEANQAAQVLYNAPVKEYGYFVVPKVVE